MPAGHEAILPPGEAEEPEGPGGALDVFRNRPFLLLWLSQLFTQIGGNMVLYGLTVIVLESTASNTLVSILILTFLGPAVLFSAVAGVYVDRLDKRHVLIATNILRAGMFVLLFLAGDFLPVLLVLNAMISTVTVFFAPAEASMIPQLVPRRQLVAANGVFTLTLNAAFAVGYALMGSLVVTLVGAAGLILVVAVFYLVAALFCWWLPPAPPVGATTAADHHTAGLIDPEAEQAVQSTFAQFREGISFISAHRSISWSLLYLGISASLVGVLGVIGPKFATESLGLEYKDFAVVVLPLGFGIVTGILVLNSFGHLLPRRRIIEFGLIALGLFVLLIAAAGPISRFLQNAERATGLSTALADFTSLLSIVVFMALLAGVAYAFVAVPAQTQLQEDIPEETRGRVFGVLNMLVSVSSFLPIIIVGPLSDVVGSQTVIVAVAIMISMSGVISIVRRGPLNADEAKATAIGPATPAGLDPVAVATATEMEAGGRRAARKAEAAAAEHAAAEHAAAEHAAADALGGSSPGLLEPLGPLEPLTGPAQPVSAAAGEVDGALGDTGRGDPAEDE
ncbi:MAG TPA: MFS transporter [Candidatus Limnocylindrales bacterium]|nr:MFS transporter [Candidatus Limnocylindrales bacterium]